MTVAPTLPAPLAGFLEPALARLAADLRLVGVAAAGALPFVLDLVSLAS